MSSAFKIFFTAFLIFLFCEGSSQVDIITERLKGSLIEQDLNDDEVAAILNNLGADGRLKDVNYDDRSINNWDPLIHTQKLLLATIAFNKPGSRFFHSEELKAGIIQMIGFYISKRPASDNWWYNAIGGPNNLGQALVLMKNTAGFGIEQEQLEIYTDSLLKYYSKSLENWPKSNTGANKIWLLNSSINKACIMGNGEVLKENFRLAFEEARIMEGKAEGIKIDNSFWQHGPQLYCAGYGKAFLRDITWFGILAHGTDYSMTPEQVKTISDAVLDGYQWFCQNSAFDFSSSGREISRRGSVTSSGLKVSLNRLISMDAPRKEELQKFILFLDSQIPFQSPGNRHFWESDIMVQHGPDFYFSAKVPSKRTNATERMNNENLKRKWLPWGATNIMREGDEYLGLFPVWDWSRIPGVTSFMEDVPALPVTGGAYIVSKSDFAGGVSDGTTGLAAYDYSWEGVKGKKAWFMTPQGMYCLGAGISADDEKPVITSVNQCFSSDHVVAKEGRKNTGSSTRVDSDKMKWIYHDGFGYIFPSGGKIALRNTDQTGAWSEINLSQSPEMITRKVFSIWIDHGLKPSSAKYEYFVVPAADASETEKAARKPRVTVLANSTEIQAVHDRLSGLYGIAFYTPGKIELAGGLEAGSDKPCLLLLKREKKKILVTVSDPTQLLSELRLTVFGKSADVKLPSGDKAGSPVMIEFTVTQ